MFISEEDLYKLQNSSHLYRGLPMAFIFYKELVRREVFHTGFGMDQVHNFFNRWADDYRVEVMFPDHSYLRIRFDNAKCFVICPHKELYKELPII